MVMRKLATWSFVFVSSLQSHSRGTLFCRDVLSRFLSEDSFSRVFSFVDRRRGGGGARRGNITRTDAAHGKSITFVVDDQTLLSLPSVSVTGTA